MPAERGAEKTKRHMGGLKDREGGESGAMKQYWKIEPEYGVPEGITSDCELFLPAQKGRAEQILKALNGLKVCTALVLLEKCKCALMQSTVDAD